MTTSEIAKLSTDEIVRALAATDASPWLRALIGIAVRPAGRRLARRLVRFDAEIATRGLSAAARRFLETMGAHVVVHGERPHRAALVVMNHPGAYDALATMSALSRDDVLFLANDRRFLRALPHLHAHLAFVGPHAAGLRRALRHLADGGVVVQLGAGAIEPDARFVGAGALLAEWPAGSGLLASHGLRAGAVVLPAFVSGVHSARAKRLHLVRWAESHGITTIGPLIQATTPGFRDVAVTFRFGAAIDPACLRAATTHAERTALMRAAVLALAG